MAQHTVAKVATDLFVQQLKWSLWYLPIVLIIHLLVLWFVPDPDVRELSFLSFAFQPTKIFMLICGIMMIFAFLTFIVKQGITRKDYFIGSALAAAVLSFSLMIITALITGLLFIIGNFTTFLSDMNTTTFVNTQSDWIIPVIVFSLIIFTYYLAGLLIGIGFYRFGGWGGLGFIAVALIFMSLIDILWEFELSHPLAGLINLNVSQLDLPISFIGTFLLLGHGLWMIRAMTKRIVIKME